MSTYVYHKGKESAVQKRIKNKGLVSQKIWDMNREQAKAKGEFVLMAWDEFQAKPIEEQMKIMKKTVDKQK